MNRTNYWCYRIDTEQTNFFINELNRGRLHHTEKDSCRQSLPPVSEVRKADILLIPDLPARHHITIVEATEDWSAAETVQQSEKSADYTRLFRIKFVMRFIPDDDFLNEVSCLPLSNVPRLRNINYYSTVVDLFRYPPLSADHNRHLNRIIGIIFKEIYADSDYSEMRYDNFIEDYIHEVCFYRFVNALRDALPFHQIKRADTVSQKFPGVDYLIKMHGSSGTYEYAIAIQIKLKNEEIDKSAIVQLNEAAWRLEALGIKIVEKWIIVVGDSKGKIAPGVNTENLKIFMGGERHELMGQIQERIRELGCENNGRD